jgi:hypothetical protein
VGPPGPRVISGSALIWDAWHYAYITRVQAYHSKGGEAGFYDQAMAAAYAM